MTNWQVAATEVKAIAVNKTRHCCATDGILHFATIRSTPTHFPQHFGHVDAAVGLLVVFQDAIIARRDGDRRAVERVDELRPLFAWLSCSGCRAGGPGSRCSWRCW